MGVVFASHSRSLDGYIAQTKGKAGPLRSREQFDRLVDRIDARIAGRR
jgi:hypothetical protein